MAEVEFLDPAEISEVSIDRVSRIRNVLKISHCQPKWSSLVPLRFLKFPSPKFPESAMFSEVSTILKQEENLRIRGHSAIVLPITRGLV
jgi:hypothetical protein